MYFYKQIEGDDYYWYEKKIHGLPLPPNTYYRTHTLGGLNIKVGTQIYVLVHDENNDNKFEWKYAYPFMGKENFKHLKKELRRALKSVGISKIPPPSQLTVIAAVTSICVTLK